MGAKAGRYSFFVVLALVVAIIAFVFAGRAKKTAGFSSEDEKFVKVYIEMALASEMAGNNPDSLDLFYKSIFLNNDVDSSWMFDYVSKASYDPEKQKLIWDNIVARLDSLRKTSLPDSATD